MAIGTRVSRLFPGIVAAAPSRRSWARSSATIAAIATVVALATTLASANAVYALPPGGPLASPGGAANAAPAFSDETATRRVLENSPSNKRIGSAVTASDPDGDTLTYSLSGADASKFTIGSSDGQIRVGQDTALNYEGGTTSYAITVKAADPGALSDTIAVTINVLNRNEPPVVTGTKSIDFEENGTGTVGTYTATDPDANATVTWSVDGTDARRMKISTAGALTFKTGPNYEAPRDGNRNNVYEVQVKASDGNLSHALDVTITVTNANEAPGFDSATATRAVAENAPANRIVGAVFRAQDPDDSDTLSYSLAGTDASLFKIGASDGQMRVKSADTLDHEAKATRTVTVTATDAGDLTGSISVTITIRDADDAGVVALSTGKPKIDTEITATLTDDDGSVSGTSWRWSRSATLAGTYANISGARSKSYTPVAGDDGYYLRATVTYQDSFGTGKSAVATTGSAVGEGNEAPAFAADTASRSVPENAAAEANVGAAVTASDPDGDTLTYSLGGTDASSFDIGSSTGQIAVATGTTLDKETKATYTVTVKVTDGLDDDGETEATPTTDDTVTVTITITDVNEAPAFAGDTASRSVPENAAAEANVGAAVTASDPDGDALTYSLGGTDASSFAIDSGTGQITVATGTTLDKETKATYTVTVKVTDGLDDDGESEDIVTTDDTVTVTITVSDVNEAPVVTGTAAVSFAENGTGSVGTYTAADPDADDSITWSVDGTDARRFKISSTGVLSFKTAPDYERARDGNQDNVYELTVKASDGSLTGDLAVTVTVTGVDEPPTITGPANVSFAENATGAVSAYTAVDPEGISTITWSLSGDDAAAFKISAAGIVKFASSPDYEDPADDDTDNAYDITVEASDGDLTSEIDVTITVSDVNEAPAFVGDTASRSVPENAAAEANVGVAVTATDPDGDTLTYSLGGTDASSFAIGSGTGQITVGTGTTLDKETKATYTVTVKVTDGLDEDGETEDTATTDDTVTVTITVTDVNEAPAFPADTTSRAVPENAAAEANVGAGVTATDPDGDTLTYSLGGTDASSFAIGSSTGQITVGTGTTLDKETKATYTVKVKVTDGLDEDGETEATPTTDDTITVTITVTDVNEAPAFPGATAYRSVQENADAGANVGDAVTATDPDGDTLTYSLGGTDASSFAIGSSTGQITVGTGTTLDKETKATYTVTVKVTDGLGDDGETEDTATTDDTVTVTITVSDVNEAPVVTGTGTVSFAENGTGSVGTYAAADPDADDSITWSVDGTDARRFKISSAGVLAFKTAPDYERARDGNQDNVYELTVEASDGSLTGDLAVTVTVTGVDEPPTVTGSASVGFAENATGAVAAYTAVDPEGTSTITWSLSGDDAGDFTISAAGVVKFASSPDYEDPNDDDTDNAYDITVEASDGGLTSEIDVTITVTDVNEAPVFSGATASRSVPENAAAEANVGDAVTATDPDGDTLTYFLGGTDAASFAIGSSTGKITVGAGTTLDKETKATYTVTVKVTDGLDDDGETEGTPTTDDTITVTITVSNVNEAPAFPADTASRSVPENAAAEANVGEAVTATDPDGDTLTYSLGGTDASSFSIGSGTGQITVATGTTLDKETKATYTVTVKVTDGLDEDGETEDTPTTDDTVTVTITVSDVNEAPAFAADTASRSVPENAAAEANLGAAITATDPDGDTLAYSLGGTDASSFAIGSGTGQITVATGTTLDKETKATYAVTVKVTDGLDEDGETEATPTTDDTITVTITVTDVNEAPVVTGTSTVSFAENGTDSVGTYTAADPDANDSITWSVDGTDARRFKISASGVLSFKTAPDYERARDGNQDNVYELTVKASDGKLAGDLAVTVTVTGVDEPPTVTGSATVSFAENATGAVAAYTAVDPEGSSTITWSLSGDDAGDFTISSAGVVKFAASPDYEDPADDDTDNAYNITVEASDGDLTSEMDVTITVTDVNEAPAFPGDTASRSVPENAAAEANVGDAVTATDPDGDTLTYSLGGTDASSFSIGSSTGQITVATGTTLDKETKATYTVTVKVTDGLDDDGVAEVTPTTDDSVTVAITVSDVNEAPAFPGATASRSVPENAAAEANVGDAVTASDPDGDSLTYSLGGTDASSFDIGSSTGQIAVATGTTLDKETKATYTVTVKVTDGLDDDGVAEDTATTDDSVTVTITVSDVNEAPAFAGDTVSRSVPENAAAEANVGAAVTASDPDGDTLTYSLGGTDASSFAIGSGTGQITVARGTSLDKETKATYTVTVKVTDGLDEDGETEDTPTTDDTVTVTITVTNVEEPPTITGPGRVDYEENGTGAVASYRAEDPEGFAIVTWSLSGDDAKHFRIDSTGFVEFVSSPNFEAPADHDADNLYAITIEASDGRLSSQMAATITVINAFEPPAFAAATASRAIVENSYAGASVGTAIAAVSPEDAALTYSLSGPDAAAFVVHPPTGFVTLGPGISVDFEGSRRTYEIVVSVSDGMDGTGAAESRSTLDDATTVTIDVKNANEAPVFAAGTWRARTIAEYARPGTLIGTPLVAHDPDVGDSVTYVLTAVSPATTFAGINSATGQVAVTSGAVAADPRWPAHVVWVTATDGTLSKTIIITIRIRQNRAPAVTSPLRTVAMEAGGPARLVPLSDTFEDADANDQLTYAASSDRTRVVEVRVLGVALRLTATGAGIARVTVVASDQHGHTAQSTFEVRVTTRMASGGSYQRGPSNPNADAPSTAERLVTGAVSVVPNEAAMIRSPSGHVTVMLQPGSRAGPFQVRLSDDLDGCATGTSPDGHLLRCATVELFDESGNPAPEMVLDKYATLEMVVDAPSRGVITVVTRDDTAAEWTELASGVRMTDDGGAVLISNLTQFSQFALVRAPDAAPALVATPGPSVADARRTIPNRSADVAVAEAPDHAMATSLDAKTPALVKPAIVDAETDMASSTDPFTAPPDQVGSTNGAASTWLLVLLFLLASSPLAATITYRMARRRSRA